MFSALSNKLSPSDERFLVCSRLAMNYIRFCPECLSAARSVVWRHSVRPFRRATNIPTAWARLSLRVLQVHMCIVYFTSAVAKSLGDQWWSGEIMWRAMNMPELAQPISFWWLASVPWVCPALSLSSLAIEYIYAILVWPRATRFWMALATIGLHIGIGLGMGLVSFAAVMIVLTGSVFLVSGEPAERSEATRDRKAN